MPDANERLRRRKLHHQVAAHTEEARGKFQRSLESRDALFTIAVLFEEAGKLARCYLKLSIATAPEVRRYWREERNHRIVTCLSVLERLWLAENEPR